MKNALAISLLLLAAAIVRADRYEDYIDRYAPLAVSEQKSSGIPASVTLAQGLLESAAGQSALAERGNNHFGIKCHSEWHGDTMLRDDDAPDECFRVYGSAAESFADHSRFLLRARYSRLFDLDTADYAAWARGLRECGYATDPNYASRLIAIIERYALYLYDTEATRDAEQTAAFIHESLRARHPVRRSRGLHYVIAAPGDTYESIARELGLKKSELLRYNDAGADRAIKPWEEVYLEKKHDEAPAGAAYCTIGEGESMHSVAQRYGMSLRALRKLNPDAPDSPGTTLRLH